MNIFIYTNRPADQYCTAVAVLTKAADSRLLPSADESEQSVSEQSWPGLFWMPPANDEPGVRVMLHVDDELAGLIEAADPPADHNGAHSTKSEPASSVPGEI